MEATEFRIKNYVKTKDGFEMYVHSIFSDTLYLDFKNNPADAWEEDIENVRPIEFTDEWIDRFNIANGEGIHNDKFSGYLTIQKDERGRFSLYVGSVELVYFEYVHELQNIWYALTGEELTNN